MNPPVTSKGQMFDLLRSGGLGNTVPMWFSLDAWENDPEAARHSVWGVRTLTPGGPCALYAPTAEVRPTAEAYAAAGHSINVSVMVDAVCNVTLMADVFDSEGGLILYGVERPGRGANWRKVMPSLGRQYGVLESRLILRRHLNPSSLADLEALRDAYPGHVYELSACDRCVGTVRGRNGVLWECRVADGSYERWR